MERWVGGWFKVGRNKQINKKPCETSLSYARPSTASGNSVKMLPHTNAHQCAEKSSQRPHSKWQNVATELRIVWHASILFAQHAIRSTRQEIRPNAVSPKTILAGATVNGVARNV